ncbi:MAG: hypothetical protein EPO22_09170 [Dehalococcoidia bacterium]|nr:MAG: hypothetical protein EPO22_09170 [Dehalococcoidia bacterium]
MSSQPSNARPAPAPVRR